MEPDIESESRSLKIDEIAIGLDKVLENVDRAVPALAKLVEDGLVPMHVMQRSLKKFRQGISILLESVTNQEGLQLALALEELRGERGGYIEKIERAADDK